MLLAQYTSYFGGKSSFAPPASRALSLQLEREGICRADLQMDEADDAIVCILANDPRWRQVDEDEKLMHVQG